MKRPNVKKVESDIAKLNIHLRATTKFGKEQPVSEPVLTEDGWKPMGDIEVGDMVYSVDGKAYPVEGVFPQGVKDIYEVAFSDGTSTRCGLEHLWTYYYPTKRSWTDAKVMECKTSILKEIMDQDYKEFVLPKLEDCGIFPEEALSWDRCFESIELVGQEECQCIQIDSPSHLYITKDYIPTHNTTLFADTIEAKFGDVESGLVVQCGGEHENPFLSLNSIHCEKWRDYLDLQHWLINQEWIERDSAGLEIGREPLPHHIKIVAFEGSNEMVKAAEEYTVRVSNRINKKKCKTINGAMGGFQQGQKYCAYSVLLPYMQKLEQAGIGVWIVSHTDNKNVNDKHNASIGDGKFKQLTSNLQDVYENMFSQNFANCVLTGNVEREFKEVGKDKKKVRYVTKETRKLYFRGTSLVNAGSGFADGSVPEYLVFDKPHMGKDFVDIVETGMELSRNGTKPEDMPYPLMSAERPIIDEDDLDEVSEFDADFIDDDDDSDDIFSDKKASPKPKDDKKLDAVVEEDDDIFGDDEDDDEDFFSLEEEKTYPDDLVKEVAKLNRKHPDKNVRNKMNEIVAPYKRLDNCPREKLEEMYDLLIA